PHRFHFLLTRRPPTPTTFPYTTLFRSRAAAGAAGPGPRRPRALSQRVPARHAGGAGGVPARGPGRGGGEPRERAVGVRRRAVAGARPRAPRRGGAPPGPAPRAAPGRAGRHQA